MAEAENKEPNRDGLEGLNDKDRKETQEILDEIGKDNADPAKPEGDEGEKKPDEKKGEGEDGKSELGEKKEGDDKKPESDGKKEIDDQKSKNERREVKLVPAWVLERHKADSEKKIGELQAQIEKFSKSSADGAEDGKASEVDEDAVKALAEKHGFEPDFVKEVVKLARDNQGKIPEEITKGLSKIDEIASAREQEAELAQFEADFERLVVPLIKAEYGDDAPKGTIDQIKEDLKGIAYTEEYKKIPYDEIYSGKKDFRGIIPEKKKGAEGSGGGTGADDGGQSDAMDLTKPLADEEIKKLSDDQFDLYMKNMEAWEKSRRK